MEAPLPVSPSDPTPFWLTAVRAAESKKAFNIRVLDLREITSFTDYFVLCTGANPRQIQAISEAVGEELAKRDEHPTSVEGFQNAEWVLADYGDFIVHVFSESAREYYDLERLWRAAKPMEIPAAETSPK
jgi:ribosome-associated protein